LGKVATLAAQHDRYAGCTVRQATASAQSRYVLFENFIDRRD